MLGPPRVTREGGSAPLELRPKAMALLVRVALTAAPISREELAEELFHDAEDPRGALRWHLAYLRRTLPPALARGLKTTPRDVAAAVETDVGQFLSLMRDALENPGGEAAAGAVRLYRGDLCEGLRVAVSASFEGWLYVEQEQLRRRFRRLMLDHARACLQLGRPHDALSGLSRLIDSDPFLEDGHVLLIECYEAASDAGAARHAYDRYSRMVRDELGAEPRASLAERFGDTRAGVMLPVDDLVTLARLTMHIVDWPGTLGPILAIHGSGGGAHNLTAIAEGLAPDYRVIAADLRGHGLSDKPRAGYELADHVADLRELLSELGVSRPIVLGYSIGGAVATALATEVQPRALVLLEGIVGDGAFIDGASIVRERIGRTLDLRFSGIEEYLAAWRAEPPKWSRHTLGLVERSTRLDLARLPDGTYRRRALRFALDELWRSAGRSDTLGLLARVRCPVLLVRGGQRWLNDRPYFSPETVEAQRRAARNATVYVAEQCDHGTLARDPEPGLVEAIRAFLKDV